MGARSWAEFPLRMFIQMDKKSVKGVQRKWAILGYVKFGEILPLLVIIPFLSSWSLFAFTSVLHLWFIMLYLPFLLFCNWKVQRFPSLEAWTIFSLYSCFVFCKLSLFLRSSGDLGWCVGCDNSYAEGSGEDNTGGMQKENCFLLKHHWFPCLFSIAGILFLLCVPGVCFLYMSWASGGLIPKYLLRTLPIGTLLELNFHSACNPKLFSLLPSVQVCHKLLCSPDSHFETCLPRVFGLPWDGPALLNTLWNRCKYLRHSMLFQ